MAIYLNADNITNAFIKFGSYDEAGFVKDTNKRQILCVEPWSWYFVLQDMLWVSPEESNGISSSTTQRAIIEPAYPYIYVP